jgi:WD40 repeat protein
MRRSHTWKVPRGNATPRDARTVDFFISYSPADERWATWIGWQLETAGYRTVIQAWDFVPGTNFIDFMDKGVSEAEVVVAVLSPNYLNSRYGRLEWQAALRADPDNPSRRLVTVLVENCDLTGLLSMITYVDLVGVADERVARERLLQGIGHALAGRAKPERQPPSPFEGRTIAGEVAPSGAAGGALQSRTPPGQPPVRRAPVTPPQYPGRPGVPDRAARSAVTLLHVTGPRFGRGLARVGADELHARIWGDLTRLGGEGVPQPDVLVVSGDLTESGSPRQFDEAMSFLTGLRVRLGLEPQRLVVVPGARDLTLAACRAYFATCEADDVPPQPPYWPKWRHFARMFGDLYQGLDGPLFDSFQPWTLFAMPDLRLVVAGLNSTMADSHREDDHYGWIGETQAAWFARQLRQFEDAGWLRVGVVNHQPAGSPQRVGPGLLRDSATLDRLLGPRLNLLLHGTPADGPAEVGELPSGLAVVPPGAPGGYQLLEVTAEGLTRWRGAPPGDGPDRQDGPERLERRWVAAGATYSGVDGDRAGGEAAVPGGPETELDGGPAGGQASSDPAGPAELGMSEVDGGDGVDAGTPEPRPPDPTSLLLDRVAEVCHTRYERARIRRIDGEPPSLQVVYLEDGFVRQMHVAVHVGTVTRAEVDAFRAQVHAADPDVVSELVYQGPQPPRELRDEALRRGVRLRSFLEFQGLLDLRGYVEAQTQRLAADNRYPPELYVPQRFKDLVGPNQVIRDGLVEEMVRLLSVDDGRFVLVLGDFGRGKTFALRELARRLPTELPHLIPILIELRTLDKVHSVDGLVAAHLANQGEELIDLRAFRYMLRQGRIVLLFDGFDELVTRLTYDQAADHLETLLRAAEDKAKIVVASRTQHFKSHAQVLTALGERVGLLPHRRVLSVEDFTPAQIRAYLVNRYRGDEAAADARLALINRVEDLFGLAQNPRMLSFIAQLDEDRLTAVAHASGTISAAGLYREILQAWLSHEEQRTRGIRGAARGLSVEDLWRAVTTLAVRLWQTGDAFLRPGDLTEVADTLTGLAESNMSGEQAAYAMGAGSLLIRTDEGMFGFIHSSVTEWLVAQEVARELDGDVANPRLLSHRPLTQLAVDFLADLADARACREWTHRVLSEAGSDSVARANALKLRARLRTPAWTDLRGASLQGEDLSYRQLQNVDLTGADLTDARLVGANLSRAVLRDARLVGARLDEAVLAGADLTGADLSRARLFRTDLQDVTVTGSRWHRAALVDVAAAARLAGTPELRGAAIVPGQPVDAELAPPAVGVPYGFNSTRSRLPEPVAYSPDGDIVAVGNHDGSVLVCDTATGLPLRTLYGHRARTYAVVYGPGFLATGAADGTVRLWNTDDGRCTRVLEGHPDGVWPVAVDADGTVVVAGGADGVVRVWDVATGALRRELPGHTTPVYGAVHAPGGELVTSDYSGTIRWWDLRTGEVTRTMSAGISAVYRLAFSPDGDLLAAADRAGVLRLWDTASGEVRHELTGHTGRIYALAYHPDGGLVVTGDTDGAVRVWDPRSGRLVRSLAGHAGAVYWTCFSPDGTLLATGDRDGLVYLWDPATGQRRHEMHGHRGSVWPTVFRPDGRQLASSANDGTARLWDTATGQSRHLLRGHGRRVTSVAFSPDGTALATSGNDGVVRLWNPRTGECRLQLTGNSDRLVSAVFNPSAPQLATASNDGSVYLWNVTTGDYQRELDVGTDHVWAENFDPAGEVLATANDDDTVQLWYILTGRRTAVLRGHRGRVRSIAFSPDGSTVATGCDDSAVRLYDAESGDQTGELRRHGDRVYSVHFDAEGRRLVSASVDGTACLWDARGGELLSVLAGHRGRLWSAAFAPDGQVLATAGDDRLVRLWDLASGDVLHVLPGHTRRIWSVAFSPDGRLLASAGDDGTVRLWDVAGGEDPRQHLTLLGLPDGWAALAPDGRYKADGEVTGQFWYAVGMCRFEPGELDAYLPTVRHLPREAPF